MRNRLTPSSRAYPLDPARAAREARDRVAWCEAISRVILEQPVTERDPVILRPLRAQYARALAIRRTLPYSEGGL